MIRVAVTLHDSNWLGRLCRSRPLAGPWPTSAPPSLCRPAAGRRRECQGRGRSDRPGRPVGISVTVFNSYSASRSLRDTERQFEPLHGRSGEGPGRPRRWIGRLLCKVPVCDDSHTEHRDRPSPARQLSGSWALALDSETVTVTGAEPVTYPGTPGARPVAHTENLNSAARRQSCRPYRRLGSEERRSFGTKATPPPEVAGPSRWQPPKSRSRPPQGRRNGALRRDGARTYLRREVGDGDAADGTGALASSCSRSRTGFVASPAPGAHGS